MGPQEAAWRSWPCGRGFRQHTADQSADGAAYAGWDEGSRPASCGGAQAVAAASLPGSAAGRGSVNGVLQQARVCLHIVDARATASAATGCVDCSAVAALSFGGQSSFVPGHGTTPSIGAILS